MVPLCQKHSRPCAVTGCSGWAKICRPHASGVFDKCEAPKCGGVAEKSGGVGGAWCRRHGAGLCRRRGCGRAEFVSAGEAADAAACEGGADDSGGGGGGSGRGSESSGGGGGGGGGGGAALCSEHRCTAEVRTAQDAGDGAHEAKVRWHATSRCRAAATQGCLCAAHAGVPADSEHNMLCEPAEDAAAPTDNAAAAAAAPAAAATDADADPYADPDVAADADAYAALDPEAVAAKAASGRILNPAEKAVLKTVVDAEEEEANVHGYSMGKQAQKVDDNGQEHQEATEGGGVDSLEDETYVDGRGRSWKVVDSNVGLVSGAADGGLAAEAEAAAECEVAAAVAPLGVITAKAESGKMLTPPEMAVLVSATSQEAEDAADAALATAAAATTAAAVAADDAAEAAADAAAVVAAATPAAVAIPAAAAAAAADAAAADAAAAAAADAAAVAAAADAGADPEGVDAKPEARAVASPKSPDLVAQSIVGA